MDAWEKARVLLVVSAVAAVALVLTAIVALFTVPRNGWGAAVTPTQAPTLTPTAVPTDGATPMGLVALEEWIPTRRLQGHPSPVRPVQSDENGAGASMCDTRRFAKGWPN